MMFPVGSSVGLWGGGAPAGTEPRSGQSVQLGHGSLLHQLVPTRLGLLQSHRHCLWKKVGLGIKSKPQSNFLSGKYSARKGV